MCTREPRLDLVSLLIGWRSGARTLNESPSEVMQSQSNSLITFDTQLKTALNQVSNIKWTPGQNWLLQNMSSVFVNPALQSKVKTSCSLLSILNNLHEHSTSDLLTYGLAKRSQHFNGTSCNIVGHNVLRTFGQSTQNISQHHATMMLRWNVASVWPDPYVKKKH